jgi:hypothetical protein
MDFCYDCRHEDKVADKNRVFQSKWTGEYFFVNDVAIFLVCSEKYLTLKNTTLRGIVTQATFRT